MKKLLEIGLLILLANFLQAASWAQEFLENSPNQFRVNGRLGFNISAKFKNLGGFNSINRIGPASGGALDRFYNDGFVRVDGSGNDGGLTWFWGYKNQEQIQGDTLLFHQASSPANGAVKKDEDPQPGFELSYARRLGRVWRGAWGIQAAFGYTDLSIHDDRTLHGNALVLTDAYPLGGVVPPLAPYAGSFSGPGPLIGDSPTRLAAPGAARISGERKLDTQLYAWQLGPYLEIPLCRKFSLQLGGGLTLARVESDFSFTESVRVVNAGAASRSGHDSTGDFLVGGYAEAGFAYAINKRWTAFSGAQYQYLSDFSQSAAGKEAELDLSKTIYFVFGVGVTF